MSTLSKETIELVDHLIETCKDGQEGYRSAAADVEDPELKQLFAGYSAQRAGFADELQCTVRALGEEEPCDHSSMAGDLHRAWINLRSALAARDAHAILLECERGEGHALKVYREALETPDVPGEVREVVKKQLAAIEAAQATVRAKLSA